MSHPFIASIKFSCPCIISHHSITRHIDPIINLNSASVCRLKDLHQRCTKEMDAYVGCMYYNTNEFDLCRKEQEAFEKGCPLEWFSPICVKLIPIKFIVCNDLSTVVVAYPLWIKLVSSEKCTVFCMCRIANPIHYRKQKINRSLAAPFGLFSWATISFASWSYPVQDIWWFFSLQFKSWYGKSISIEYMLDLFTSTRGDQLIWITYKCIWCIILKRKKKKHIHNNGSNPYTERSSVECRWHRTCIGWGRNHG